MSLDLDAYFHRIGYDGPRLPTLATLTELHRRHTETIPFENLDVLLGRGVRLDVASLQRKLVRERRGGYCFEQNGLFLAVLRALGFHVVPGIARVRWQVPADVATPQSHMILRVQIEGVPWLADVGFGGVDLTTPIRLDRHDPQLTEAETRRISGRGRHLLHEVRLGDLWHDVYLISPDEAPPIDFEVGNWFTSTHPDSRFRQNLIAARADGSRRLTLFNREFTRREIGGATEKRELTTAGELLDVLAREFGLRFPAGTRFGAAPAPWPI